MLYGSRGLLRQCCAAAAVLYAVVALARLQGAAGNSTRSSPEYNQKITPAIAEALRVLSLSSCAGAACAPPRSNQTRAFMAMLVIGPVGATQEKVPVRAAARTYSLLDAPSMTGAFFGVSMNFSAWSGGLPEYMASSGVAPVACALLSGLGFCCRVKLYSAPGRAACRSTWPAPACRPWHALSFQG